MALLVGGPSDRRLRSQSLSPFLKAIKKSTRADELIPLAKLLEMTFPPSDRVETFYDESERLVRFLAATDKQNFLSLLDALARHQPFDSALAQSYGGKLPGLPALEEKFREYASKEFGTSLQQAGGG